MDLLTEALCLARGIQPQRNGRYVLDEHGPLAAIHPVENEISGVIDLVAWTPQAPSHWWLRTGRGVILGAASVDFAYWCGARVYLVDTPARWVLEQAYGRLDTVCVLQRDRAAAALSGIDVRNLSKEHRPYHRHAA